ncbi:sporulation histidine kinase inhibitor Sda [Halobacillus sp. A1]|uniref:Sporulation histidine kinase inhibitor Sda n=1 Tax=Halobacillus campisalis TaxID=435909 RepID=A0ABW2K022_9BACI|nr:MULTISPECIES: sporulation histidine kinase inhibitor Sda [Halobacillus]MCP3031004.1 sporulation histidine kinase inhibitor Sda [Halobacillus sp. A1]
MNLNHLSLRILLTTYRRAVELDLDDEFILWIRKEIEKREQEKQVRAKKANL